MRDLMTRHKRRKLEVQEKVYRERRAMMEQPGAMATAVDDILMEKYDIGSRATIWAYCKEVEARLAKEQADDEEPLNAPQ